MTLAELVLRIARAPSTDDLWRLHPHLLALNTPESQAARDVAGQFYAYLSHVSAKLTAKDYSSIAAKLAAGSVGALSAQELVNALRDDRENALRHLLVGGLAEGLEVLSTVQHVKAWETEFAAEHEATIWELYRAWWQVSVDNQPDLSYQERAKHVDALFAPVRAPEVNSTAQLLLIISLFQTLLLIRLVPILTVELHDTNAQGAE